MQKKKLTSRGNIMITHATSSWEKRRGAKREKEGERKRKREKERREEEEKCKKSTSG